MRRELLALGGAAAILRPLPVKSQQPSRMPVIGFLGFDSAFASRLDDFRQGLGAHGFAEGKNVEIEYRWASGDRAKLPVLAQELVRMKVDVIATGGGGLPPRAVAAVTETIPIVASSAATIVESLARPQGNLTGAGTQAAELNPKRLELLHTAVPDAAVIAVLNNPAGYSSAEIAAESAQALAEAAAALGQLPPEIRLTINLKTASEIGFTVPPGFRDRADEVIE